MPVILANRARQSRDISFVDCVYLLALAREQECVVAGHTHQLQKGSGKVPCLCACVHFRLGTKESHNHSHL